MRIKIEIDCNNAAFTDGDGDIYANEELGRIFSKLSNQMKFGIVGDTPEKIRDINGNTVGTFSVFE